MTTVAISGLPVATVINAADIVPFVQAGTTKSISKTLLFTSPALVTPALGTVASGNISACTSTSMVLTTPVLGTVTSGNISACTSTSMVLTTPVLGTVTSGNISNCTSTSMVMVSPILGIPTSGTLTSCTGLPLTTGVTGALPVANGGTGASATVQSLSGAGAVNITSLATAFTSTATGNALTLADGAQGQLKTIIYVAEAAGGDTGVLTPTNLGSGTTITFNAVGDSVTLQFAGTDWWVVGFRGAVVA